MKTWRNLIIPILAGIMVVSMFAKASAQTTPTFKKEEIDQLVAPIALYPDELLSQVLMAATYPADVAEAAKWSKANSNQKGDDAVRAVEGQPWDPSVKALAAFPQVLQMMGEQPDWVQNIGDAFLASSKDVLDSAQRLRAQAQQAGNLQSNEQQKVVVEQKVIKIEPANPEVVYVPTYNPTVIYGSWPYPSYQPYYLQPPPAYYPGTALASGLAFGVGVGVTAALWSDCNWGHGDVDVNVNKYNNVNTNRKLDASQTKFQHNADNRRGVPYRDTKSRQQYAKNVPGSAQRSNYRGRDPARDAQRQQAQASLQQRGMDPSRARESLRSDQQVRNQARQATQASGRRDNALRDAGNGRQAQQQFDRGSASRQSMAQQRSGGSFSSGRSGGGSFGGARGGGGGGGGARMGGGGGRGGRR